MTTRRRISAKTNSRRTTVFALTATLIATPLVAIAGGAAYTMVNDNSGPVNTPFEEVAVTEGEDIVIDDAAVSTKSVSTRDNPDLGVVKEFRRDDIFDMVALTWDGAPSGEVFVRAEQEDGSWSDWYEADPEDPADDVEGDTSGSEMLFIEPTNAVQISTVGVGIFEDAAGEFIDAANLLIDQTAIDVRRALDDAARLLDPTLAPDATPGSDAANEIAGEVRRQLETGSAAANGADPAAQMANDNEVKVVFASTDPGEGNADASGATEGIAEIAPAADGESLDGMPEFVTREGWGADENMRCRSGSDSGPIKATTVHHTAGSNNYTPEQSNGIMRGIYRYHAQTLGWCDVGYNALVDKYGTIFEGRAGGMEKGIQGAHAGGFNQDTWGISMIGDYDKVEPPQEMLDSVALTLGWRMSLDDAEPTGDTTLTSTGFSGSRYSKGSSVDLPNIFAHRDVGNTNCPGDTGYAHMDDIRDQAQETYDKIKDGTFGQDDEDEQDAGGEVGRPENHNFFEPGSGNQSILASVLGVHGSDNMDESSDEALTGVADSDQPLSYKDIPTTNEEILAPEAEGPFGDVWRSVLEHVGEPLGVPESGIQTGATVIDGHGGADPLHYVKFEHGIVTASETTGAHAIWGPIADAWADQGFELGPLGAPVSTVWQDGSNWFAQFQGGLVQFNDENQELKVEFSDLPAAPEQADHAEITDAEARPEEDGPTPGGVADIPA